MPDKPETQKHSVVSFHPSCGGAGATMLTAETAVVASSMGISVVAADFCVHGGSLRFRFDLPLKPSTSNVAKLLPVAQNLPHRECIAEKILPKGKRGIPILPAPDSGEADGISNESVRHLLNWLSSNHSLVLADTSSISDSVSLATIFASDLLVLLVTPEINSIYRAKSLLASIGKRQNPRVCVVINRFLGSPDLISTFDIESYLGISTSAVFPEETFSCRRASQEGNFISEGDSTLSRAIRGFTRRILLECS
ncbi:MAG: hypothetical protein PHO53_00200 [Actinomycetota bacterium]|nr:hypothetical protein [Actinomycetota bacterium]